MGTPTKPSSLFSGDTLIIFLVFVFIEKALEPLPSAVADGHHRYTTAIELSGDDQLVGGGYVLAFIGDLRQEGLHIHPTHRIWSWNPGDGPDLSQVADRIIEVLNDGEGEEWSLVASNGKEWTLKTRPDLDQPTLARRLADVVGEFDGLGAPATPHLEPVKGCLTRYYLGSAFGKKSCFPRNLYPAIAR